MQKEKVIVKIRWFPNEHGDTTAIAENLAQVIYFETNIDPSDVQVEWLPPTTVKEMTMEVTLPEGVEAGNLNGALERHLNIGISVTVQNAKVDN